MFITKLNFAGAWLGHNSLEVTSEDIANPGFSIRLNEQPLSTQCSNKVCSLLNKSNEDFALNIWSRPMPAAKNRAIEIEVHNHNFGNNLLKFHVKYRSYAPHYDAPWPHLDFDVANLEKVSGPSSIGGLLG